ncbi:N-glycosylation protein-domain-containing protein [Amylostereum chailletii]|nr:N-glycosylation protein-domain-containing protein [Amylostereum chailletii]
MSLNFRSTSRSATATTTTSHPRLTPLTTSTPRRISPSTKRPHPRPRAKPPAIRHLHPTEAPASLSKSSSSLQPTTSPPPYSEFPPRAPPTKSRSTPQLSPRTHASFLVQYPLGRRTATVEFDADSDEGEGMLYTSATRAGTGGFRSRFLGMGGAGGMKQTAKSITTAPGQVGAGETETEADEPVSFFLLTLFRTSFRGTMAKWARSVVVAVAIVACRTTNAERSRFQPRHLPTSRIVPESDPIVPPNTLEQVITPLLFEASRLLSIVPAVFGFLYNVYYVWHPPDSPPALSRLDFFVSALWAVLTGVQCLYLTTGLLVRWKVYYPPLSTLIRLLALQAICWPATHFTLTLLDHARRPVICWAVIGSTTSLSRSIQLWVTSNLWWEVDARGRERGWRLKLGGRWGGRRWDWGEVLVKCGLPMGICYFVMAWAEALRREWEGC